jgi:predicted metal-dependent hydrolase
LSERLHIDGIAVELRRNPRRRRRIGIGFDPQGVVVLDAPMRVGAGEIEALVLEHGRWLRHRLEGIRRSGAGPGRPSYATGEVVHYLGLALVITEREGRDISIECGCLLVPPGDTDLQRELIRTFLADRACDVFAEAFSGFACLPWIGGKLPPWRHSFMRSQWGSCSPTGTISLNTHLVQTSRRLIDYVVLHELCHLRYRDHGRRFRALLDNHMPDWRARSRELAARTALLLDS